MNPSEVSSLIVGQHRAVAQRLTELSRVASTLQAGGPAELSHAVELALTLCDVLAAHIGIEDTVLVPALRDVDAWGSSRADVLIDRLGLRQEQLECLRASCTTVDGACLSGVVDRFVDDRRSAMTRAALRDLSVLRDDVVAIDFSDG